MITFKEWKEGIIPAQPELGLTGGPPVFHKTVNRVEQLENKVEQLENKVYILAKIVRKIRNRTAMRFAS